MAPPLSLVLGPLLSILLLAWFSWQNTLAVLGGGLLPAALGYMGQAYTFGLGIALAGGLMALGALLVFPLNLLEKMDEGC
jgi:hypothetical protein